MARSLTIGTFNLRNLIPVTNNKQENYFYSRNRHNAYPVELYEKKISWIAHQLDKMDSPLTAFQEVFDPEPLEEAIARSKHKGKVKLYFGNAPKYKTLSSSERRTRIYSRPRVALMAPKDWKVSLEFIDEQPKDFTPFKGFEDHRGTNWTLDLAKNEKPYRQFTRPVLKATITLPYSNLVTEQNAPATLVVFIAHFKSKRPITASRDDYLPKDLDQFSQTFRILKENTLGKVRATLVRALDAAALRFLVLETLKKNPNTPVILVGDLNDDSRSVTTDIAAGLSNPYFKDVERNHFAADLSLFSAYDLQTVRTHRDVYYSHIFHGFHQTLDHIMVSRHFVPRWKRNDTGHEAIGDVETLRVYNDHLVDEITDHAAHKDVESYLHTRSDHAQVTARLSWNEHS